MPKVNSNNVTRPKQKTGTNDEISSVNFELTRSYSGPLPRPEELEKYGKIVKGGAERIFVQFEKQSEHRHSMEAIVYCLS